MQAISLPAISLDKLESAVYTKKEVTVVVLRLDKIHPLIAGNKWFKLRYYIAEAKRHEKPILTFGGAWSNHILATAALCKQEKIPSIGIIRGEESSILTPTLNRAKELGMELKFISRADYEKKILPAAINSASYFIINEGGYGLLGVKGAATMLDYCIRDNYTAVCCAAGTGTMMAGLVNAALPTQEIIGISVLKNNLQLTEDVKKMLEATERKFRIIHDYHFGGYAKYTTALIGLMNNFFKQHNIPSDFVYTGKLFYAVDELIQKDFFPRGSSILLIHSGGLQGNDSLKKGMLIF